MLYAFLFLFSGVVLNNMQIVASQDPCDDANNQLLSDLSKRGSNFSMDSIPLCDRSLDPGWYRTTFCRMVTTAPALTKCGTLYPVWLNGVHPAAGIVATLPACQVGFSGNCDKQYDVEVKNCGTFMVYKLQALDTCSSAYCFDADSDCFTETPANAQVSFHSISWTTVGVGITRHDPSVNLICDFTPLPDDTLHYNIDWYIDDDLVVDDQTVQKSTKDKAILTAADFLAKGKKIGTLVHCVVGAKKAANNTACFTISSSTFYAGIQVLTPQLSIPRKGSTNLRLKLTIPFADHTLVIFGDEKPPSPLYIQLDFPEDIKAQCTTKGTANQCDIEIHGYNYSNRAAYETDNWKEEYEVTIYNKDTVGYDIDARLTLRLSTGDTNGVASKIFQGTKLPDIPVSIYEDASTSVWKGQNCYAHFDPHMRTFDGVLYECQQSGCLLGKTYILYRNEKYKQEVQVKHQPCYSARCVCAVAVRAGRDIFTIDRCSGTQYINFPLCDDKELKVIKVYDMQYKVYLPTGTRLILNLWNPTEHGINVDIYPSLSDVGNTTGLCGTLDGDQTNDFFNGVTNANDEVTTYPDSFSKSWSLEANDAGNMFSSTFNNFASIGTSLHRLCTCRKENGTTNTECSYKSYTTCETWDRGKEFVCGLHPSSSRRRRRAADNFHARNTLTNTLEETVVHVQKRQTMAMSEHDATTVCTSAFEQSKPYSECILHVPNFSNSSLENCIKDLSLTGVTNLTQVHIEAALSQCSSFVQLNGTLQREQPELTYQIINLCPNNCSNHGICNEGNCTCEKGYAASDCSMDLSVNPTIDGLLDNGLCDKTEDLCNDVTMIGQYFVENMGAICYIQRREIQVNGIVSTEAKYEVPLEERTLYEGYCELNFLTNDTWITEFRFNISIDGKQFTETYNVYVYQSSCQVFNNESGSVYFSLKDGYCFIEGRCVTDNVNKTNDPCLYCDISANKFNWSVKEECSTSTSISIAYEATTLLLTNSVDITIEPSSQSILQTSSESIQMSTTTVPTNQILLSNTTAMDPSGSSQFIITTAMLITPTSSDMILNDAPITTVPAQHSESGATHYLATSSGSLPLNATSMVMTSTSYVSQSLVSSNTLTLTTSDQLKDTSNSTSSIIIDTTTKEMDVSSISTTSDEWSWISIALAVGIAIFAIVNVIIILKIVMKKCQNRKMQKANPQTTSLMSSSPISIQSLDDPLPAFKSAGPQLAPSAIFHRSQFELGLESTEYHHGEDRPASGASSRPDSRIRTMSPTTDFSEMFDNNRNARNLNKLFCVKH